MLQQKLPVHSQRVPRTNTPVVDRGNELVQGSHAQNHEIIRKICKRTDNQHKISSILAGRSENLSERGARVRFSMSEWTCCALAFGVMARDAKVLLKLNKDFSVIETVWRRVEASRVKPSEFIYWRFVSISHRHQGSVLAPQVNAALLCPLQVLLRSLRRHSWINTWVIVSKFIRLCAADNFLPATHLPHVLISAFGSNLPVVPTNQKGNSCEIAALSFRAMTTVNSGKL